MTELEMHLLNALEQLQQDYTQRLKDWESAFTGFAAYVRADTTGERATEGTVRRLESAGAEISRAGGPLESVIYHEQQIRDEQERQARLNGACAVLAEEQEREARVWRGPSIGM